MKKLAIILFPLLFVFILSGCNNTVTKENINTSAQSTTEEISPKSVELFFPRENENPVPVLVNLYKNAKKKIDVAIYSFTQPEILKALTNAKKRGIEVRVIVDREQSDNNVMKHAINTLLIDKIPVKVNIHTGLMHLKMSIIDDSIATTGSYNYTKSATETNDEMFVVVKDPAFAKKCEDYFNRMWNDNINFRSLTL
ncbi:phospholipase D (PLD) family protein [Thermodesulfobium narugense DSM 14796]|uniref:phospholipase D n=1 Tax=Thermodesulfobium narugense DSM 14796 TaxID=747365 RepID=M1E8W5_9BACT|nr:phospholipase D-like domain-containing protein [Thermodesulfobium narugense]AEE14704.1 phospholipase D (PLD) family protein [Thermodesulfobium narugense DSM 14796]